MSPTRRDFIATASAAVAAGLIAPATMLRAAPRALQEPAFTPLRRNVGTFTMRGGTIGWLVNERAVVVVDSQFPAEGKACLDGLNTRSGNRGVDFLVNTHHHGDHTAGNVAFRGAARSVVAHAQASAHMRQPPGGQPPADQLFPTLTFTDTWSADVGDERVHAHWHGRAHTSGDAVITFERANVVHMGDLMFNQRHPVVDGAAGASLRSWRTVLERTIAAHDNDTIYIFGHANTGLPVTGGYTDLQRFRDYLGAVLQHVEMNVRAGRTRDEIFAMREPLPGFESFGRFGNPGGRDPISVAYAEVTGS